eukprot:TRINITY_DN15479_c0_g2_i1.p1 TRINITY_DN15479_c0_g2~~TRINITY_DN15479_c0_g2_i1.p1  ORF type:complete len:274 (-),score=56.61 TRINITY_DN15479_c0_g2_i1:53-874(-)
MAVGRHGGDADYYGVLGLARRASADEVKQAYRTLSKVYHPDKAAHLDEAARRDRERVMVSLNVAYQVLSSPRQRHVYDLSQGQAVPAGMPKAPPRPPSAGPASARTSASGGSAASAGSSAASGASASAPAGASASVPKPRYTFGSKYTQSSRQARRMDPAQYTTHVDGRAAEFSTGASAAAAADCGAAGATTATAAAARGVPPPGPVRHPTWLRRQLDVASEWEQAHCPPEAAKEAYQWKRASNGAVQSLRERRQNRERLDADTPDAPPVAAL